MVIDFLKEEELRNGKGEKGFPGQGKDILSFKSRDGDTYGRDSKTYRNSHFGRDQSYSKYGGHYLKVDFV
jgi:hypothetical protein